MQHFRIAGIALRRLKKYTSLSGLTIALEEVLLSTVEELQAHQRATPEHEIPSC
eukprot:COSAG02_NODE_10217_length_1993_cov_1.789197_3_plen_54_part_00